MSNPSTVLVYPDAEIVNSRTLATGTGLSLAIGGPQGTITINPGERLSSLAEMPTNGIVCYTASTKTYNPRSLVTGVGIGITNPTGQGSITISQVVGSVVQKVQLANSGGSILGSAPTMKFIAGSGISLTLASDGVTNNVTIANTSGNGTVTSVGLSSSNAFLTIGGTPITTSGTLAITVNTLSIAKGGTGQVTKSAAFNALSPIITTGDLIVGSGASSADVLSIGAAHTILSSSGTAPAWVGGTAASGNVLTYNGTNVVWAPASGDGTVTSVGLSSSNAFLTIAGTPVTTSGTLAITVNTLSIAKGGTGQITASAAFNALSPVTTAGDLILGNGANSSTRLAIGSNNTYLKSNGTTASWVALSVPTITVGTQAAVLNETPVTVTCPQVTGGSTILLSLYNTTWSTGNLTPGIQLNGISAGASFQIKALNVGGANMASSIDVMWTVIN